MEAILTKDMFTIISTVLSSPPFILTSPNPCYPTCHSLANPTESLGRIFNMDSIQTCHLPNEIWYTIFSSTRKKDLKNVRLSSKLFYMMATPSLFDRLFIGPSQMTLEVFQNIVNHPYLSKHIKTLVYDAIFFQNFPDLETYTEEFKFYYTRKNPEGVAINKESASISKFERCILLLYGGVGDPETSANDDSPFTSDELAMAADIVAEGFQRWKNEQRQQLRFAQTGEMQSWLTLAFCKLPHLASVRLQKFWGYVPSCSSGADELPVLSIKLDSAGPLARSWSPWYLPPGQPRDKGAQPHTVNHLISTLAVSNRFSQIRNLTRLTLALHVSWLSAEFAWGPLMAEHWSQIVSSLTHIKLQLYVIPERSHRSHRGLRSIDLLTSPLTEASRLQYLDINVDRMFVLKDTDYASYYRLTELFNGPNCSFNSLTTLKMRGFRASAEEFISFFSAQPALRHLDIGVLSFIGGKPRAPEKMVSLWTLIDGVNRLQLKRWSLAFPVFEESTKFLIPKKKLPTTADLRKLVALVKRAEEAFQSARESKGR